MVYSTSNINIQLIKKESDSKNDDSIIIRKNLAYNEFELSYTERDGTDTAIVFSTVGMTHAKVLEYVYILLKNQSLDNEPYAFIQVNNPAMPRVIFAGDKFEQVYYREHVYEMISTGLDLLDTTSSQKKDRLVVKKAKKTQMDCTGCGDTVRSGGCARENVRPQHLFFDEDDPDYTYYE